MNTNIPLVIRTFFGIFLILTVFELISFSMPVEKSLLKTNIVLILTHLVTVIGLAAASKQSINISMQFIRIIGMAYMLISLIGFMGVNVLAGEQWKDVIYLNLLNYIQFALGVMLSASGAILKNHSTTVDT